MKYLLLLALAAVAYLFFKKSNAPRLDPRTRGEPGAAPARAVARKPLDENAQALFARLQATLPSTMVLVRPTLGQIVDTGADAARLANVPLDFAVCRKDATPIGVVVLDDHVGPAAEQAILAAGLRFARFRSASLPDESAIKDALGFL